MTYNDQKKSNIHDNVIVTEIEVKTVKIGTVEFHW